MDMATIETALGREGLIARGGFHPEPGDSVPALDGGRSSEPRPTGSQTRLMPGARG